MLATVFETDAGIGAGLAAEPHRIASTEIAERLHERRERWGYSYTVIPGDKAHDFAPIVAELTGT